MKCDLNIDARLLEIRFWGSFLMTVPVATWVGNIRSDCNGREAHGRLTGPIDGISVFVLHIRSLSGLQRTFWELHMKHALYAPRASAVVFVIGLAHKQH